MNNLVKTNNKNYNNHNSNKNNHNNNKNNKLKIMDLISLKLLNQKCQSLF